MRVSKRDFTTYRLGLALVVIAWFTASANAAPQGGQVVAGDARIVQSRPNRLDIVQRTGRAAINWQSFNIGARERVNFRQPSRHSATLNRVTGQDISSIQGRLTSNGQVFLVNPNGILFGKGAKVDVGGLVASTANIGDEDFMAGRYAFKEPGQPGSRVVNEGEINAAEGGLVAFVAPGVENAGTISARLGRVALASGEAFTLDLYGDELVDVQVDDSTLEGLTDSEGRPIDTLVKQSGTIRADGGEVLLTAARAQGAIDNVINMSGIIRTRSVGREKGEIVLYGGAEGKVQVSGVLDASGTGAGESGGKVRLLGDDLALRAGARVDVSGNSGGGKVLLGGDYQGKGRVPRSTRTVVERGAKITADALEHGSGGKVIVWSDGTTHYHGHISAEGGTVAGDGGLIEVSGKKDFLFRGGVDLTAAHGAGGTLLLDPENITVAETGSDTLTGDPSTIKADTISNILGDGGNVLLDATNNIGIFATIDARFADAPPGGGLRLLAGNDILIDANILTKNGPISMNAGNSIFVEPRKILFSDSSPISLTAAGPLSVEHLVTTGDVTLSSTAESVFLGQDLGAFKDSSQREFRLGRLSINANQGMVSLKGLQTTGDVEVTAFRNVDVNGPIQSGGNVTLTSQGTNDDKTAINLKHNIYTLGGNITFAGDVLLNPTASELVVPFDQQIFRFCPFTLCSREVALRLCPSCEEVADGDPATDGDQPGILWKKESDVMRFAQINVFDAEDNHIVMFLDQINDTLADAEQRVTALAKLFELRQVTVDSQGGDIMFQGKMQRETFNGFENFQTAFPVNGLAELDGFKPGVGSGIPRKGFGQVVFTDSFIHHGLALSAGSGDIVFKETVGNKRDLIVTLSNNSVNDPNGGNQQFPPALGSFRLSITSANSVNFENGLFLNNLTFKGVEIIGELSNDFAVPAMPGINVSGASALTSPTYGYNTPPTTYSPSTNHPRPLDFSGITGGVIPGELPVRPGGGGSGGGGSGKGGGGEGGGDRGGGVIRVLSQIEAPFRSRCGPRVSRVAAIDGSRVVGELNELVAPTEGTGEAVQVLNGYATTDISGMDCPEQGILASADEEDKDKNKKKNGNQTRRPSR